jgi:hypothetical protein
MKKSTWSVAVYVLIVFASGVLVGAFGHRLYSAKSVVAREQQRPPKPEEYRKGYVSRLEARLKLTAEQVEKLNAILDGTRSRYREIRERTKPEMKQIQEEQVQQIESILNAEQQKEYAKFRAEREKARHRRTPPGC